MSAAFSVGGVQNGSPTSSLVGTSAAGSKAVSSLAGSALAGLLGGSMTDGGRSLVRMHMIGGGL